MRAPAFQTGFNYGVQDAGFPPNVLHGFGGGPGYYGPYINQTGKGLDHHSVAFGEGYIRGWCEVKRALYIISSRELMGSRH